MNRLYQWLGGRARNIFSAQPVQETGRMVRSEVTVRRESTTVVLGAAMLPTDICPLCGQSLVPEQVKQVRLCVRPVRPAK